MGGVDQNLSWGFRSNTHDSGILQSKAHVDDLGTGFHTRDFTQVRALCSKGNTLLLLGVLSCLV